MDRVYFRSNRFLHLEGFSTRYVAWVGILWSGQKWGCGDWSKNKMPQYSL